MIAIIGAMEEEVAALKEQMEISETLTRASMTFFHGTICQREVVVVQSGIGKVNAAICTQILADAFHPEAIFNTGVAGSLNPKINIGDVVLSTDALQHDVDTSAFGNPLGQIPHMDRLAFPTSQVLSELAQKANHAANPDISTWTGRVLSGDQFLSSTEKKQQLIQQFGGVCVEMEGAAIAQTAYLNEIPCLIIRAISDKADNRGMEDYPTFKMEAIDRSVRLMMELLKTI